MSLGAWTLGQRSWNMSIGGWKSDLGGWRPTMGAARELEIEPGRLDLGTYTHAHKHTHTQTHARTYTHAHKHTHTKADNDVFSSEALVESAGKRPAPAHTPNAPFPSVLNLEETHLAQGRP